MSNYQRILVAVDFSEESASIIQRAAAMADQNGASIDFIHVVEYTSAMYAGDIPLPEELNLDQQLTDRARERLSLLAADAGQPNARQRVEMGAPAREIVRVAEDLDSDLIVIGSHGRRGLQLLLGSTANGVLHQARCDVLAVRVGS